MFERSLIQATRQGWKLVLPLLVAPAAALVIVFQEAVEARFGPEARTSSLLVSTLVSFAALAVPCISIRCPRCHNKLFWHAVREQPASEWLWWLLSISECPGCGFQPHPEYPLT